MEKPRASIALATYNGERFLREQLESLLSQTYEDFEIVVTDDGSTDGTWQILEEYSSRDKRVRISKSKFSRGFINNFTGAIGECKGEIIFLCDQDDVWHKDKVRRHMEAYEDKGVVWVYNKVLLVSEIREPVGQMTDTFPDYYSKARRWILNYVWGSCILGCTTSYRASAIRKFLPPDREASAHDSWIQLALWPTPPHEIDEVLQEYRLHGNNTSNFKLSRSKEEEMALEKRAIADNLLRLRRFAYNPRFQLWKRGLF